MQLQVLTFLLYNLRKNPPNTVTPYKYLDTLIVILCYLGKKWRLL